MRRRDMKGIPRLSVSFGNANAIGPLHARLGIATHVHRQAILNDPRSREYDWTTRSWSHQHLYRDSITLAGAS